MANPSGPATAFDAVTVSGVPTMGMNGLPLTTGRVFFADYVNGSDGNTGGAGDPFKTVYWAFASCVAGRGDVVAVVSNGAASGSQRLSLANAQIVDPTLTAGTLNWNKNNTHLVGVGAPTYTAQRARLAPPTGTYTAATFGSGNFVVVTGSGCIFSNISLFNGFSTGGTNQICWTENGSRNAYFNVDFGGMADAASAADAGSRSLKIGSAGSGENTFYRCNVGIDTVTRSAANASLELAGGTPRNRFIECTFPFQTSSATVLGILGTGAACVDRTNFFTRCEFVNNIKSTSTQMTVLGSFTNAAPGGLISLKDCTLIGATKWGDTNFLANSYVDGGAPTAGSTGLGVNPS